MGWFRRIIPDRTTKNQTTENTDAMNTKNKPYEPKFIAKDATTDREPLKTVSLQVAVTRPDFQNAVRKAFELAKSGGRELDLAFSL
jgi:sugar/nucleoside kinase (ribokinase family)